jgi:hypothetical protein
MDRVTFAIALNNEGVSKLSEGEIHEAVGLFRHSLNEMKSMMKQKPVHHQQSQSQGTVSSLSVRNQRRQQQQQQVNQSSCSSSSLMTTNGQSSSQHQRRRHHNTATSSMCLHSTVTMALPQFQSKVSEEGFIYGNPLILNHLTVKEICTYQRDHVLNIYSACIVFNLALSYHCSSYVAALQDRGGLVPQQDLKNAGQMYALVLKLLRCREYNQRVGTVNLLLLASMNNLSHVLFFDLAEYERALDGFQKVATLLAVSRVTSSSHPEQYNPCNNNSSDLKQKSIVLNRGGQGLRAKDKSGLMWNISMLKLPCFAAAA